MTKLNVFALRKMTMRSGKIYYLLNLTFETDQTLKQDHLALSCNRYFILISMIKEAILLIIIILLFFFKIYLLLRHFVCIRYSIS